MKLDGTLYVDFYNNRRSWTLSWELLSRADYDVVKNLYDAQFSNQTFTPLVVDELNLNVFVYINISDTNIKWDNRYTEGFQIVLEERNAIS